MRELYIADINIEKGQFSRFAPWVDKKIALKLDGEMYIQIG
jgi:hypothetical protein